MTIRISFSNTTVRVAVEVNGAIESKVVELPQRTWVGLTDDEKQKFLGGDAYGATLHDINAIEAKLKDKNNAA
jgi:hypothetical protein